MRIGHVTSSISRNGAGVSKVVRDLAETQAAYNDTIHVFTLLDRFTKTDQPHNNRITVTACPVTFMPRLGYSRPLRNAFRAHASSVDLIHMHGLWMYPNKVAGNVARKSVVPYIMSPHGMLEPWGVNRSKWKKKIIGLLFEWRNIKKACCIHACSEQEYLNIRLFGYKGPVAVVPLGLTQDEFKHALCPASNSQYDVMLKNDFHGKRILLFLSRLHFKKGVESLLKAWETVRNCFPGWCLVIAGDGEVDYVATLKAQVSTAGLDDSVAFIGAVHGEEKWALLKRAEIFVLPTLSENFGLVVAEALACAVPVITTKGAPWNDLEVEKCGWWIDTGTMPLAACLSGALSLSPDCLAEMGKHGRRLVEHDYLIERTARMLREVYGWMLHGGSAPDCVRLD